MKRFILLAGFILILLTSCSFPTPMPTLIPSTQTSRPVITLVPPSATPVHITLRVREEKVNCRFGPGVVYAFVNELEEGQSARVIGRNESSTWWYIRDPGNPGGVCWISAQVTKINGDAEVLPVIAPPFVSVADVSLRIEPVKIFVACDQFPQTVFFESEITAKGPAVVVWKLESSSGYISAENMLVFEEAGAKVVNGYYHVTLPGDYWLKMHILKPNDTSAQLNFPANCSP